MKTALLILTALLAATPAHAFNSAVGRAAGQALGAPNIDRDQDRGGHFDNLRPGDRQKGRPYSPGNRTSARGGANDSRPGGRSDTSNMGNPNSSAWK